MNVGGVEFPDSPLWLPNTERLNQLGEDVLAVAYGALVQQELFRGTAPADVDDKIRYNRKFVGHGTRLAVPPSKANQLTVFLVRVHGGRAGEELFTFLKGEGGKLGFQTAHFSVELSQPWPKRTGPEPIHVDKIDERRPELWRDGLVVWAALVALAMGGVRAPHIDPSVDQVAVGPMVPRDPNGGVASWVMDVQVQM